ncbi:MAG: glycosyltransferase [Geitlerinemataceae cyanobacterium]
MKVAYLINQYPKVSHSFIRREIVGLESCGVTVARYAIRTCDGELVDEEDKIELQKTRVILAGGIVGLLSGLLRVAIGRPGKFLAALRLALQVGWGSERGVLLHLAYLAEACILLGWMAEDGVDRVHAHFGTNPTAVAMLCRVLGGPPYSFTVHGPEEFDKVQAIALPEKIARAAFVVAVSSFGRSQLYRWCDARDWSKIHVVHCGVDRKFLAEPPTAPPTAPQLVCVGRLSEQKGHLLLVEAANRLAQEGIPFKLVFVGDGELRSAIETAIDRGNLPDRIEITGWASNAEVRDYLLASRVLVLPSFAEGLPVGIMEALALGRPVVSTYVAGIPELVETNVCGWLVPPGSVEALTDVLRVALQTSPEVLAQMGRIGAERVAQHHDATLEARKLAMLFGSDVESSAINDSVDRQESTVTVDSSTFQRS